MRDAEGMPRDAEQRSDVALGSGQLTRGVKRTIGPKSKPKPHKLPTRCWINRARCFLLRFFLRDVFIATFNHLHLFASICILLLKFSFASKRRSAFRCGLAGVTKALTKEGRKVPNFRALAVRTDSNTAPVWVRIRLGRFAKGQVSAPASLGSFITNCIRHCTT